MIAEPLYRVTMAIYRGGGRSVAPLARRYLRHRAVAGREDALRLPERLGHASVLRPPAPLIWAHAVSVGESLSMLPLLQRLLDDHPACHALLTTGTTAAAELVVPRLPTRALHQFVPVDLPLPVARFMAHWRPDLVLWTESEFWPGLLSAIRASGAPVVLVNGRVSARSYARWRRFPPLIQNLLGGFTLCFAQSETDAEHLRRLGAPTVRHVGNLKLAAPPLAANEADLAALRQRLAGRPRWLAASTHPGEEDLIAAVHRRVAAKVEGLLTLIVPRHPRRGTDIAAALRRAGLTVALRSAADVPGPETAVYVADTLGELGLWFRLCGVVFIGGSLVPHGGQNPLEPARLDCAILHGPHMDNFAEIVAVLDGAGGAKPVGDAAELAATVERLLVGDPAEREAMASKASACVSGAEQALERLLNELSPLLAALERRGRAS